MDNLKRSNKPIDRHQKIKNHPIKRQGRVSRLWHRYKRLRLWHKIVVTLAALVIFVILLFYASTLVDTLMPATNNPEFGVSFSTEYAQELGLNWKNCLLAIMNDLHIKRYRFMTYWEQVEPQPGVYNYSDVDWQMNQAVAHNYKVSLAIGLRQPRWPECHQPQWAAALQTSNPNLWQQDLLTYITNTVDRYKNNPALQSWQLENESQNTWFGDCIDHDRSRIIEEFNLIKKLDPNHPVYMSLSDETGIPIGQPTPDAYGFSIYRIVWNDKSPFHFYITYPTPLWFTRLRALYIRVFKHRPSFIHELQMEPWGPKSTEDLTTQQQYQSMSPAQMKTNLLFARKTGLTPIYMWGGEWWYYRLTIKHDPQPWNIIKQELIKFPN